MTIWQPIQTAPRDGTGVILFYPQLRRQVWIGHFFSSEDFEYGKSVRKRQGWNIGALSLGLARGPDPEPSHWMPFPAAPESESAA